MKKINSSRKNIFSPIIKFFDRCLITPITKLILFVTDYFKNNDKGIEKILTNRQSLIIISLIFALLAFYAIDRQGISLVDDNAEILSGIPVNPVYNQEAYVIEGLPETVDVTLIGNKQNVYLAKQYPAEEVMIDLSELTPGTHKVTLDYKQNVSSVTYKVDPSTVTVVVYKKISETREVTADVIHKDKLDTKLDIKSVTLSKDRVTIKGPEYKLDKVASVKALIDIDNLTNQKEGTQTLSDVQLVAYDNTGNIVDIEIVPDSLEAEIVIASPKKTVPVKVVTEGELDGKAIKSLSPSVKEVTLYGSQEALDKIEYLPVVIDISGINTDKNYTINLTNPTGVREISDKTISVKLVVDEVVSTEISGVKINITNLADGYTVQAVNEDSSSIAVIVKGSQSVINGLDASSINAYIDLTGLVPNGKNKEVFEVDVKVTGADSRLTYTPRVKKVKVQIEKK